MNPLDTAQDYDIYRPTRFKRQRPGVSGIGRSADYHYRNERDYLYAIEAARDMDRNDPVIGQGVNRVVQNVIRQGVTPDPDTGSDNLDRLILERWNAWAETKAASWNREFCFHDLEKLVFRATIVDGDSFVLPTNNGALRIAEAHRVRTPKNTKKNVVHGVHLDDNGVVLGYHFTKEDLDPNSNLNRVADTLYVPSRDKDGRRLVFHIFSPKRFSQRRGFTCVAPVEATALMHYDIHIAKLVQQQMVSMFGILRTRQLGYTPQDSTTSAGPKTELMSRSTTSRSAGGSAFTDAPAVGMMYYGEPGEVLQGFSPGVPNPEFFPHVKLMLTYIAINLGLPYAALVLDMSEHNFNSWRGAMDQAKLGFSDLLHTYISRFHEEVYQWKLESWIDSDPAFRKPRKDVFNHTWKIPVPPYIEPLADSEADESRRNNLQISPSELASERGYDYERQVEQIIADNVYAIRAAATAAEQLNSQFKLPIPINWQDCLVLPMFLKTKPPVPPVDKEEKPNADSSK